MTCKKCGAEMQDTSTICPMCGEKTGEAATIYEQQDYSAPAPAKKSLPLKVLLPVIIGVIAVIVIIISVVNSGYKSALNKYFKAIEDNDAESFVSVMSDFNAINLTYSLTDVDEEDLFEMYEESLDSIVEHLESEYGSNFKITYDVIEKETVDSEELKEFEEEYQSLLDDEDLKITDAVEVEVDITIKGDEDEVGIENEFFILIKENGKWKILTV